MEWLLTTSSPPVREQLVSVERRPLGDQGERASRKRSRYQLAVEIHRSHLTPVAGMEVWTGVRTLVPYIQIVMPKKELIRGTR